MSVLDKIPLTYRAAGASFLRVLGAAGLAAYMSLNKLPNELDMSDLRVVSNAVIAAGALTLINALRSGEKRFGTGTNTLVAVSSIVPEVEPVVAVVEPKQ